MRKSIYTLGYLVSSEMNLDILGDSIFIFSNKRRDTLKILYWDGNGFCLWVKKLEKDRFPFPSDQIELNELSREKFIWSTKNLN